MNASSTREFLVVAHTGREAVTVTLEAIARACSGAGIRLRIVDYDTIDHDISGHPPPGHNEIGTHPVDPDRLRAFGADVEVTHADTASARGCELVIVLGGDGTFLRAAELAYPESVPVLGINLGRIGFLAEAEANRVDEVMARLIARDYRIESRMTLDISVINPQASADAAIVSTWALNEVAIQNRTNQGVLELLTEVDGRPVSAFGADGLLVSTPTGSTAYAFSAGGPVMWPDLEAILIVPSNAHALFARPMVTSPRSKIAVEVDKDGRAAVALCDGRRVIDAPPGSRVEVVRGHRSVHWVRIDSDPFADRLVTKFDLPVTGWRGRKV